MNCPKCNKKMKKVNSGWTCRGQFEKYHCSCGHEEVKEMGFLKRGK
jgi:predicted RNA-binding Zn-ribbon protein involved in translation (DUF1610 family)